MTMQPEANAPEPEGLQFDHAEFTNDQATATVTCAGCRQPIVDHYFEINGATLCEPCRNRIESHFKGGSGFLRLLKAMVFGTGAAIAGAAIYFVVLHFLHIQAALVSILCGFIIGKAVRKGSEGRGGWIYQILAIALTYLAIGIAYSSVALATGQIETEITKLAAADPQGVQLDGLGKMIVMALLFVVYVFILPFLVCTSDIISAVIVLFALWEAWKFTKKAQLVVTGPYRIGDGEPDEEIPGVAGHA